MKIYQKQLLTWSFLFALVVGGLLFVFYRHLGEIKDFSSRKAALTLTRELRPQIEAILAKHQFSGNVTQQNSLRQALLTLTRSYEEVVDIYVEREQESESEVTFTLSSSGIARKYEPVTPSADSTHHSSMSAGQLFETGESGVYVNHIDLPAKSGGTMVVVLNTEMGMAKVIHDLNLQIYIIVLAGVIGILLASLVGVGAAKAPIRQIERAMTNIAKRKYGLRIKSDPDGEYNEVYNSVNTAIGRLEQLDTVQREAVQRKKQLVRERKTMSRFLNFMAHEIKNPLHAIIINLDVLKTKIDRGLPKNDVLKNAHIMETEVVHLQEVIKGFLQYARPGVPQKERVKINAILQNVCEMAENEADAGRIKVETKLSRSVKDVRVDSGQIQQALLNIVINAIHATPDGGKINIRSWSRRKNVLVSVKDSGEGISKDQMKKIFDLYFTTKKNGTGIGLPLTKRIVEANGGQLQLDSTAGKGTTVTFVFPAA